MRGIMVMVVLGACYGTSTQTAPPSQEKTTQDKAPAQERVADQPGLGDKCAPRNWPADSCRESKQCQYGCVAPLDVPLPYGGCTCPAGQVCFERCMGMGCKEWCEADCTTKGCGDGFRCAKNGRCEFIPCTEGYACKAQARCEPGKSGADFHGCVQLACNGDRDCPCEAFCVLGQCHAKPGKCQAPPMG